MTPRRWISRRSRNASPSGRVEVIGDQTPRDRLVGGRGRDESRRRGRRGANPRRQRVQGETVPGGADPSHGARAAGRVARPRAGGGRRRDRGGFGRDRGGFGRRVGFRRDASTVRAVRGRGRGGVRSNSALEDDAERSLLAQVPRGAGGRSRGTRAKGRRAGRVSEGTDSTASYYSQTRSTIAAPARVETRAGAVGRRRSRERPTRRVARTPTTPLTRRATR